MNYYEPQELTKHGSGQAGKRGVRHKELGLNRILGLVFIGVLSGCVSTKSTEDISEYITPMQAIEKAAEAAPKGIKGFFELHVKATGKPREVTLLNSELDYRDPRNITVAIHPKVIESFKDKYGETPDVYLKGKKIIVYGEARKVKISFGCNGERNKNEYYYQTHVRVGTLSQIHIVQ
jgi:hypothetical protein